MEEEKNDSLAEARLLQADEHASETNSLLETIITQNEENNPNPILESLVMQGEETNELLKNDNMEKFNKRAFDFIGGLMSMMKGDKGEKGDKGDNPTKDELINLIKPEIKPIEDERLISLIAPLIPEPIKGADGLNGENGKDGRDGKDGEDGKDGKDGRDGKIDNKELDKKIKIILSKEKIKISNIDGIEEYVRREDLFTYIARLNNKPISGGLVRGSDTGNISFYPVENLSSQCNGANTIFTLANNISGVVWLSLNGAMLIEGLDFTHATNKITIINPIPSNGEQLYVKYF